MKLNNKGMTTVEIVVCFILVTTISLAMYSLVSSFNDKREEESNRAKMLIYKATITKKIQEDFIKKGLISATIDEKIVYVNKTSKEIQEATPANQDDFEPNVNMTKVECVFKDGSKSNLIVLYRYTRHELHDGGDTNNSDFFEIEYGAPNEMEIYELPDLGQVKGYCEDNPDDADGCTFKPDKDHDLISKDLKISNVFASISNEENTVDETSHILNIYIGFNHPDLGNRYAINIVAPINYQ